MSITVVKRDKGPRRNCYPELSGKLFTSVGLTDATAVRQLLKVLLLVTREASWCWLTNKNVRYCPKYEKKISI